MSDSNQTDPPGHDEEVVMLANRLRKNQRSIGKWARQQNLQCYRLYDADLPEYAFAIDRYDRFVHMQEYQPPACIDEAKASLRREQARAAAQQALSDYRHKHRQDFVVLEGAASSLSIDLSNTYLD